MSQTGRVRTVLGPFYHQGISSGGHGQGYSSCSRKDKSDCKETVCLDIETENKYVLVHGFNRIIYLCKKAVKRL